jgi:hypothetical protein
MTTLQRSSSMAIPVEKLNGEPIILMTVDDDAEKGEIIEAYNKSVELANSISGWR